MTGALSGAGRRLYLGAVLALAALGPACGNKPPPGTDLGADTCDAGDEAWVQRVFPLVLGRKPHGAAEVRLWAQVAEEQGRDVAVLGLTHAPEYVDRWQDWVNDALYVARTGDRAYSSCFGTSLLVGDTGELARWIGGTAATGDAWPEAFNMADVVRSSIAADDLSAAYRVNLFARMNRPIQGANVGPMEMEETRRQGFGETFNHTYLNRNLVCMQCHNSEYAVTDSDDPAEDRHWPMPGLFEKALYGSSFGEDEDSAFAVFRYVDLVSSDAAVSAPWGIDGSCGRFAPSDTMTEDYLGHESYFVQAFGESGSTWQVEAFLQAGVDALADRGLVVGDDGVVDGPDSFAWLVGASITDQVWKEAMGERLTIATYFPRNEAQQDRLQAYTRDFVEARYSLRTLLVDVTTDPYFNAGAPATCTANPYGMDAVVNPWSKSEEVEIERGNGPGDSVHRHSARVLIRSVHDSMGWSQPSAFPASADPIFDLESATGAFLRESQPGFNGTDFQGALAFESVYGACTAPSAGGADNGCTETPGYAGCASCTCQDCVCAIDSYCCDVQWDDLCVASCNDDCGGCGGGLADVTTDTVDRLLESATDNGSTVGDVVVALKDRLVARGEVSDAEQALVEALLGVGMDLPLAEAGDIEPALRTLCGAVLLSPDYFLALDAGPAGAVPPLALDADLDCENAASWLAKEGVVVDCGGAR